MYFVQGLTASLTSGLYIFISASCQALNPFGGKEIDKL